MYEGWREEGRMCMCERWREEGRVCMCEGWREEGKVYMCERVHVALFLYDGHKLWRFIFISPGTIRAEA